MEKQEYKADDLYIAAYILAKGVKMLRAEREPNRRIAVFIFAQEANEVKELENEFLFAKGTIEPKAYVTAIKNLKDIIYSIK